MNTQTIPRAYGDAFIVNTPNIDKVGAMMLQDQRNREVAQQRQAQQLDEMFQKNIAGVRDEDVPDVSDEWGKYKQMSIDLYKSGNKLSNKDRIAKEMEKQRQLGMVSSIINDSKTAKNTIIENAKKITAKPENHYDNAATLIAETNGVRTRDFGKLKRQDPNGEVDPLTGQIKSNSYNPLNYDEFIDRGNSVKWQPILTKAIGKVSDRSPIIEKMADGLGENQTVIKAANSPSEFYSNLGSAMVGSGQASHFHKSFKDQFSDADADRIIETYSREAQTNPLWKQAWGAEGVRLPENALLNPVTRTLALVAMKNALDKPPVSAVTKRLYDKGETMRLANNLSFNKQLKLGQISRAEQFGYSKKLIDHRASLGLTNNNYDYSAFDLTGSVSDVPFTFTIPSKLGAGVAATEGKGYIRKGVAYNVNGTPYGDGEVNISGSDLPDEVIQPLRKAGSIDKDFLPDKAKIYLKNSGIDGMQNENGGVTSRQSISASQYNVTPNKGVISTNKGIVPKASGTAAPKVNTTTPKASTKKGKYD